MYIHLKILNRYLTYPILLLIVLGIIYFAIRNQWDYKIVYGATTVFLVLTLILLESVLPLKKEWSMTKRSVWRDFKYLALDAPTIIITKTAFGSLAIFLAEKYHGPMSGLNVVAGAISYLLIFEFLQYGYHRLSHRDGFFWKIHLAHHLPDKVYVVMHGVFNPLNIFFITAIIQGLIILLGVSPEAALAATLMIDLQSLVSHFNADIRMGPLNYIFIGPETHRHHHSADSKETFNFGNTLAIWDQVFGTFKYTPGQFPDRLGVNNPAHYPDSNHFLQVIGLPFFRKP